MRTIKPVEQCSLFSPLFKDLARTLGVQCTAEHVKYLHAAAA